jgi:hypothetical protein
MARVGLATAQASGGSASAPDGPDPENSGSRTPTLGSAGRGQAWKADDDAFGATRARV